MQNRWATSVPVIDGHVDRIVDHRCIGGAVGAVLPDAGPTPMSAPAVWEAKPSSTLTQDIANMHRLFRSGKVKRDMAALREVHPGMLTFEQWLPPAAGYFKDYAVAAVG